MKKYLFPVLTALALLAATAGPAFANGGVNPAPPGCGSKGFDEAVCLVDTQPGLGVIATSDSQVLTQDQASALVLANEQPTTTISHDISINCMPDPLPGNSSTILALECIAPPTTQAQFADALAQAWALHYMGESPWYSGGVSPIDHTVYHAVDSYFQSGVNDPNDPLTVADAARIMQGR